MLTGSLLLCTAASAEVVCKQCHSDWTVLGQAHPAVSQATLSECLECHKQQKKPLTYQLHAAHSGKAPCTSCHELKDGTLTVKGSSLRIGKLEQSDWEAYQEIFADFAKSSNTGRMHLSLGLGCRDCHGVDTPTEMSTVKNSKCESCHGSIDSIAAKTVPAVKEQNPHKNHQGSVNCSKCHSGHGQAKSFCSECHNNFRHTMPEEKTCR